MSSKDERIGSGTTVIVVVPTAAIQPIRALVAEQHVIPIARKQDVVAGAAIEIVVALIAVGRIVAVIHQEDVIDVTADADIFAGASITGPSAGTHVKIIVTVAALEHVAAVIADQNVVAAAAIKAVIAGSAINHHAMPQEVPGADDDVVPIAALNYGKVADPGISGMDPIVSRATVDEAGVACLDVIIAGPAVRVPPVKTRFADGNYIVPFVTVGRAAVIRDVVISGTTIQGHETEGPTRVQNIVSVVTEAGAAQATGGDRVISFAAI